MPGINWQRCRIPAEYPTARGDAEYCGAYRKRAWQATIRPDDLRYCGRPAAAPNRVRVGYEMSVTIRRFPKLRKSNKRLVPDDERIRSFDSRHLALAVQLRIYELVGAGWRKGNQPGSTGGV